MEAGSEIEMHNWFSFQTKTPSSYTGPWQAAEGIYYKYIESSSPRKVNDSAVLESVDLPSGKNIIYYKYIEASSPRKLNDSAMLKSVDLSSGKNRIYYKYKAVSSPHKVYDCSARKCRLAVW